MLRVYLFYLDDSFSGVHIIKDPKTEVKISEMIGKGGFGEVYKGQWRGTPVAVKLLTTDGSQDAEVEQEVAIHKYVIPFSINHISLHHDPINSNNAMHLHVYCTTSSFLFIGP